MVNKYSKGGLMVMPSWINDANIISDLHDRFSRLYVPAVCDVLDEKGLRFQTLESSLIPLDPSHIVAGPAFTIVGHQSAEADPARRIGPGVIDDFMPGVVACYDAGGDTTTGVWGELWTTGAMARGCTGAVVDGGIRDTPKIAAANFPIFHKFRRPTDALGRFTVVDRDCAVNIGGVRTLPGDYVYGDRDGIVIIPNELLFEVLSEAEALVERETQIRLRLQAGESPAAVYREFGKL